MSWIPWKKENTFIICNRGELVQIGLHVLKSSWRYTVTFNIGAIDCIGSWGFSFIELSWHDFRESYSLCTRHEATGDISQHPACPKINHVIMLNKMSGFLASNSMIRLASKILCQSDCHLRWLCVSDVNSLLHTACERRWQGLSYICLASKSLW